MDAIAGLFAFLFILLGIGLGLAVYLLPAIIGFMRKKENAVSILVLNLLLGWSLIAWVIALVWATSKDSTPQQVIIHNNPSNQEAKGDSEQVETNQ